MSTNNDGGPAFPASHTLYGMSLRDYFAAQIAAGDAAAENGWGDGISVEGAKKRARAYYAVADAMLEVRKEP